MNYKKFLIQKMPTSDGEGNVTTYPVKETVRDFGCYLMGEPLHMGIEAKNMPSNDWPDENGLEEYLPDEGLPLKSYDIELTFGFRSEGSNIQAGTAMKQFRDYLSGRDGTGVWMDIYSEYTNIGRQKVRFVSMSPSPTFYKTKEVERLVFKVTLKVDDPITDITLQFINHD